ncbi:ORF6N domain-containing protein [Escherichia coli]|uniref:KilA-N DNA-binding domain-containing protein n=1 Tax=Shigella boydii TaxID=621 RepID=A0A1S9IU89_SHIBO|nr:MULTISPECIES: ORF6N domain-containing protein [Enterobacteriaceae]ECF7165077.1 ORF6N domain-containing protein [Salmonella enterica subsp. enterica]EHX5809681.1 ORF6N domain-containing protein [Shigella dysenteriae]EKQ7563905.1 ORF6N domain-containing protein [Salmonella enterica subsp. enterica serovar 4,[5],12:i:-]ECI0436266.1 ORF6N domain-containing protein [Salmonella enterica subsp. enterica]EEW1483576.1 ORF6N domain-containing protein [Escherichia coli]
MTTQISVETLSPITHNQIPVITTELLAQLYGAEVKNIQNNYARNAERFIEGKHFFKVAGDALKNLRVALNYSQNLQPSLRGLQISPKARSLILWTERGAARHAKMLETDQAWDVFEKLEDCYFSQKDPSTPVSCQKSYDTRVLCYQRGGVTVSTIQLRDDDIVISLESWLELARANGWFVVRRDKLVERLMQL